MENPDWDTHEKLGRLVKILTHSEIVRPDMAEIAIHHAYGAMMQSACLSRQVGAALVDRSGISWRRARMRCQRPEAAYMVSGVNIRNHLLYPGRVVGPNCHLMTDVRSDFPDKRSFAATQENKIASLRKCSKTLLKN